MCIGVPMQLVERWGVQGLAQGRGQVETVDLRLVGGCEPGSWLLVFNGAARDLLTPQRAAEIDAALNLLEQGLAGHHDASADPGFVLPSSMSAETLATLAGHALPVRSTAGPTPALEASGKES
jgi:hydrogenase expression/formation protein HypC